MKAAGGVINHEPPDIRPIDECIINLIIDMAGERNMNGDIPYLSVIKWGEVHKIPFDIIQFYWDVIKTSEGIVKEWQSNHQ